MIGTGISGMGAGYFLREKYDITFYEKNDYVGGHTNTLTIDEEGQPIYIDSAFMVFNEITYPLLTALFKELDVQTKLTSMSFSVQHKATGLEYSGTGLDGLFAQRKNIFNPKHIRMLLDIDRFRQESLEVLINPDYFGYSLARYIKEKNYSDDFLYKFLVPMSSAVWSSPFDKMLEFPAATLVRFFKNHCFLGLKGQLQWRTCVGGSRQYRDKIMNILKAKVFVSSPVSSVNRKGNQVEVALSNGQKNSFDYVLLACHADDSLQILKDATSNEKDLLSKFPYHLNDIILHVDSTIMPKLKKVWSSWNYRVEGDGSTSTIYWMNCLQGVSQKKDYFISVNNPEIVAPNKVLWQTKYAHPSYNIDSQRAQEQLGKLNGTSRVFFAGAYFRYGFHEDGLWAALEAARALAGENLWG
ncbi:MAG: FAD-dependent oxidoreductase [Candidatus Omnitrophota bacterium]